MHELGGMEWVDDECDAYSKDACARAWGHVRKKALAHALWALSVDCQLTLLFVLRCRLGVRRGCPCPEGDSQWSPEGLVRVTAEAAAWDWPRVSF